MQAPVYIAVPVAMILIAVLIYRRIAGGGNSVAPESPSEAGEGTGNLQPVIDIAACMGSGGCARACPDRALAIVRGKAVLADAARCFGHGSCAPACPAGAISFVPRAA